MGYKKKTVKNDCQHECVCIKDNTKSLCWPVILCIYRQKNVTQGLVMCVIVCMVHETCGVDDVWYLWSLYFRIWLYICFQENVIMYFVYPCILFFWSWLLPKVLLNQIIYVNNIEFKQKIRWSRNGYRSNLNYSWHRSTQI